MIAAVWETRWSEHNTSRQSEPRDSWNSESWKTDRGGRDQPGSTHPRELSSRENQTGRGERDSDGNNAGESARGGPPGRELLRGRAVLRRLLRRWQLRTDASEGDLGTRSPRLSDYDTRTPRLTSGRQSRGRNANFGRSRSAPPSPHRQSRILDVLLVERGDVLVPEARDRHVKDVFRQNMERIRGWSSARLCDLHLAPRESHRMDHGTAYRHGWYVTLFGQLSRSELRGKLPERIGSLQSPRPILKCCAGAFRSSRPHLASRRESYASSTGLAPAISSPKRGR